MLAQHGVYERAMVELRAGRKESHWMWFVYPQLRGLGRSEVSRFYGLADLEEAVELARHPVLGPRIREAARIAATAPATSADELFGGIDALKLRSSMTLFRAAVLDEPAFQQVLDRFFGGRPDEATLRLLEP